MSRSQHIDIRVSAEEHAAITRRALTAGVPTARFLRQRALQDDNRPVIMVDSATLKEIYRALRSVSNNVNQIARALNTTHNANALENDLKAALAATERATDSVADFLERVRDNL